MVDNGELVWEDPPKGKGRGRPSVWLKRLLPLFETDNEGEWARVYDGTKSSAHATAGRLRKLELPVGGRLEVKARTLDEDQGAVWARWLAEEEPSEPQAPAPAEA